MKKLTKLEKKVFAYLDRHVSDTSNKNTAIKMLKSDFGFTPEEVVHMYTLWYYSKGEDLESYEYDEEGSLLTFIKTISSLDQYSIDELTDDLYDSGKLDKILGSYFNANCGGWNSSTPCISFKEYGIQLELDRDGWENYFSGLGEDDLWVYYNAHSNYSDYYEEVDSDEFNYVYTNEETIGHLKTLSILAGKDYWPGKEHAIEHNEVNNFLSEILPRENYETIVDDYLSEVSIALTRSRVAAARYCYENEVKYNTNNTRCESGDYCIFIPYDDLIGFIKGGSLINLSELKDHEINGEIYLHDCWYDTWVDDDGYRDCVNELNRSLDNTIEKLSEDVDLEELLRQRTEMMDMLEKMGFVKYATTKTSAYYKSKDGKIDLHSDHINYKDKKIRFTYEGKPHLIPIEDFPNWVYGTPLDLNESVRVNKKLLKEQTENINKISIFDFDGTLMKTPDSTEGKKQWEEFYGKDYPHIGWWGKPESLDDAVFDIQPIESTVSDYKKEMGNPNTFVIMLTGRLPHQSSQVEELLALHNIYFKEYHYKSNGDTLTSKLNTIKSLLNRFPQVKDIEMWEDREAHVNAFGEWGKENGVNIKVNYITDDVVPLNESTESMDSYYEKVSKIVKPPFIFNLEKMGFDYSEVERVLSHYFGERVYLYDDSAKMSDGVVIEWKYWIKNKKGFTVYDEEDDFWSMSRYDDNGNEIYYEDSESGVIDTKKPFTESVEDKLYDKILPKLRLPFGDFLLKMGFDRDTMKEIFVKKFGPETRFKFFTREDGRYELYINDANRNQIYFETNAESMTNSGDKYDVYWEYFGGETKYRNSKYRNSDGRKRYRQDDGLGTYDTQSGNWGDAPIEIKKDKFFTESEDKFRKYHTKISNVIKQPYFRDLKSLKIDFQDWQPVLSIIFDREVILDGVSASQTNVLDPNSGDILYLEWDWKEGYVFANRTTGEYKSTLPD